MGQNMAGDRKICFTKWLKIGQAELEYLADFSLVCQMLPTDAKITYALACLEVGKTEKPHIHGYVCYENQVMYSRLKKLLGDNSLHCEAAKGAADENKDYIFHEGKHKDKVGRLLCPAWEYGVKPKNDRGRPPGVDGVENALEAVIVGITQGRSDADLMQVYPAVYVRYYTNILRIRDYYYNGGGLHALEQVKRDATELDDGQEVVA